MPHGLEEQACQLDDTYDSTTRGTLSVTAFELGARSLSACNSFQVPSPLSVGS